MSGQGNNKNLSKALGALDEEKNNSSQSASTTSHASFSANIDASAPLMILAAPKTAKPGNGDDVIWGTPNEDILKGRRGDDTIYALESDDKLYGGRGDDTLYGHEGSDLLSGGKGDDILVYSSDMIWPAGFAAWNVGSPGNVIDGAIVSVNPRNRSFDGFDGGKGEDTILMSDESDVLVLDDRTSPNAFGPDTARIKNVEIIKAGGGDDVVDLTSMEFAYGDVTLYGGDGDDVLWTSEGNDVIYGGAGRDHIDGGVGDDILFVGEGKDKIYGRDGGDLIVYDTFDSALDRIYGFDTGAHGDVLNLTDILEGYNAHTDAISDFVQITDTPRHTAVYVNPDGDEGGQFTMIAVFDGGISETVTELLNNGNLVLDQSVIV